LLLPVPEDRNAYGLASLVFFQNVKQLIHRVDRFAIDGHDHITDLEAAGFVAACRSQASLGGWTVR
jgi:hypothetical protein